METKETIVKGYSVPDRIATSYVAIDGKEFATRRECELYEEKLESSRIRNTIKDWISPISDSYILTVENFMKIENEEQLAYIKSLCGFNQHYDEVSLNDVPRSEDTDLNIGDWVTWSYDHGGDSYGHYKVYTLAHVIDRMKLFIQTVEGELE